MGLVGGVLLDIIGARLCMALAVVWWSIMGILTGFANSIFQFETFRFLLGIGEGVNWPGASKVVAEWFPAKERGVAVALFDSGSSVGGAIAAVAVPWVALFLGWRYTFAVSGLLGFLWLLLWLRIYYPLAQHPRVSQEERTLIETDRDRPIGPPVAGIRRWANLARQRNLWGVVIGRSLTDPIWWFYIFWLPQYLSDARGFSLKEIAAFAWIPFVAADIGNFTGGFASAFLIKRGMTAVRARKWVCVISCLPILAGIPAATIKNAYVAIALISIAVWGYAAWATMGLTFPSDLFTEEVVGSVTGLSALGAGLAGTSFTLLVGTLVDHFSYLPAFFIAATMPILATGSVLFLIRSPKRS
jgi:ACS family hexuronate transporter-like MFS transporter